MPTLPLRESFRVRLMRLTRRQQKGPHITGTPDLVTLSSVPKPSGSQLSLQLLGRPIKTAAALKICDQITAPIV